MLHGRHRNHGRGSDRLHQQTRIDELVWEQRVVFVRKHGLDFDGPGRRIDLVVDGQQHPAGQLRLEVAVVGVDGELPAGGERPLHAHDLVLRDGEHDGDRMDLRDDSQPEGVVGPDNVAGIDQSQADPAADGSRDPAVVELQPHVVDDTAVDLDRRLALLHQSSLRVDLLPGDLFEVGQRLVAFQIPLCRPQGCLAPGQRSFGLCELHFVGPRIDLRQQISRLHGLPLLEGHLQKLAFHAAADRDGVGGDDRAEPVEIQIQVGLPGRGGRHRHHPLRRGLGLERLGPDQRHCPLHDPGVEGVGRSRGQRTVGHHERRWDGAAARAGWAFACSDSMGNAVVKKMATVGFPRRHRSDSHQSIEPL